MSNKIDQIINDIHTCYHCGNTGILRYIDKVGWVNDKIYDSTGKVIDYHFIEGEDWYIFECPVCKKPVLISLYFCDDYTKPLYSQIEYPTVAVQKDGVPINIYNAFESAIKTKKLDPAICLLSLRRVLEMICKDKGAEGKNLYSKIKDLVSKNIFTPSIDDACWIIRQLGNKAAHADNDNFHIYEIEQVIEYIALIIEYLYSMPYHVSKLKKDIESRNK